MIATMMLERVIERARGLDKTRARQNRTPPCERKKRTGKRKGYDAIKRITDATVICASLSRDERKRG